MEPVRENITFGYICPKCGRSVVGERTAFAVSAGLSGLVCDCGESELVSEPEGLRLRLQVPCGVCGGEHVARLEAQRVLQGESVALSCPERHQLCCCVGEEGRVTAALQQLQIAAEKLRESQEAPFADSVIMYEVLSELREIAGRGGISCACGSRRYTITVRGGAVDLVCQDCGGKLRIGAATDEDLDQLCCRYTLTIPGRPAADGGSGAKP